MPRQDALKWDGCNSDSSQAVELFIQKALESQKIILRGKLCTTQCSLWTKLNLPKMFHLFPSEMGACFSPGSSLLRISYYLQGLTSQLLHSIFLKIAKYSNFISQHLLTMLVLLFFKKNHSTCTKTHAWPLSFFHLLRQSEP